MVNFYLAIIVSALFFLVKNFKRKIFIGNCGTLFISILVSIFFIGSYSNKIIFVDEIFLCMAIPGYDLIRVSLQRLSKGKHMFSPDNNTSIIFCFLSWEQLKQIF